MTGAATGPEFRWRLTAYFKDGTGAFALAVAFILAAGAAFAHAFRRQDQERRTYHELLSARVEPYRNEDYQVANAAVLHAIEAEGHASFPARWCEEYEGLVTAFERELNARTDEPLACWAPTALTVAYPDGRSLAKSQFVITRAGTFIASPRLMQNLPPHHQPLAAGYARTLLHERGNRPTACANGRVGYQSLPYVDVAGNGPVTTYCTLLTRYGEEAAAEHPLDGDLIYCVDFGWERGTLVRALARLEPTFDVYSIVVSGRQVSPCVEAGGQTCLAPAAPAEVTAAFAEAVAAASPADQACDPNAAAGAAPPSRFDPDACDDPTRATSPVGAPAIAPGDRCPATSANTSRSSKVGDFLVVPAGALFPNARAPSPVELLVLRPANAQVIEIGYLSLGLLLLLLGGAAVFYSHTRQRERARMTILAGLPIPVIVTRGRDQTAVAGLRARLHRSLSHALGYQPSDQALHRYEFDEILYGNPAAESLLDCKLPRMPAGRVRRLMQGPLATLRFVDWLHGADRSEYEANSARRMLGERSDYKVTLRRGSRIVRVAVIGNWIRRADGRIDSFGVIQEVSP